MVKELKLDKALAINAHQSVTVNELFTLAEFATQYSNILEVGSYKGRSSRVLGDNTNGKLTCIDPWDGQIGFKGPKYAPNGGDYELVEFLNNLHDLIGFGKVKYFKGEFKDYDIHGHDMVFIDAIHEYESVKADINHAIKLMDGKGLICGHDFLEYWPGVIQAVQEVLPNYTVKDTIWYVKL